MGPFVGTPFPFANTVFVGPFRFARQDVYQPHMGACQNYGHRLGTLTLGAALYKGAKKDHDFDNEPDSLSLSILLG